MYSRKYSGMDKPKKRATPVMKRFLIEFIFVNCKNDNPTEALDKKKNILSVGCSNKTSQDYI